MDKKEIFIPENLSELRYVNAPATVKSKKLKEDLRSNIIEKMKMNPFIPLGMFATTAMIALGFRQFVKRNSQKQQFYMKGRVVFQFLTFFSFVAGGAYHTFTNDKQKRKEDEIDYSKY